MGGLIGAGTGALIGSQFGGGSGRLAATAGLSLLGAIIGAGAGESMDRADQVYLGQTTQQGLEYAPSGAQLGWQNPDTGNYGTITPQATPAAAANRTVRCSRAHPVDCTRIQ